MGIYALGRLEFADVFPDQDEAVRIHLIEAKIFLAYTKDLSHLNLQEARLRRQQEEAPRNLGLTKMRSYIFRPFMRGNPKSGNPSAR
jgi:hypothetical protein